MSKKKYVFYIFLYTVSFLLLWAYPRLFPIQINMLDALDRPYFSADFMQVYSDYEDDLAMTFIVLVGGRSRTLLQKQTEEYVSRMISSGDFEVVEGKIKNDILNIPSFYFSKRMFLLTDRQKYFLKERKYKNLEEVSLEKIYSPFSVSSSSFVSDPYLLMEDFFNRMVNPTKLEFKDGYLEVKDDLYYLAIKGVLKKGRVEEARKLLDNLKHQHPENLFYSSIAFYGQEAVKTAKEESSLFSTISAFIITIIFFYFFRSFRHLFISAGGMLFCSALGLYLTSFVLGPMHIMAFLLGISILGVMDDYYVHYYMNEFNSSIKNGKEAFKSIQKSLFWSLATTLSGFAIFLFSNISLLRQFGLFCAISLVITFFFIKFILKHFYIQKGLSRTIEKGFYFSFIEKIPKKVLCLLAVSFLLITSTSLFFTQIHNDIHSFATPKEELKLQENEIRKILGLPERYEFFIIKGADEEILLQREEKLRSALAEKKLVANFISNWVPSISSQKDSFSLYEKALPEMNRFLKEIGAKNKIVIDGERYLTLKEFQDSFPDHEILKQLKRENKGIYSIVPIYDSMDNSSFYSSLQNENIIYVNKILFINHDLSTFSHSLKIGIILFIILFFIFLVFKFNLRSAFYLLFPSVFAFTVSLHFAFFFFSEINLFHILAGVLIMALGLDYSFFYYFHQKDLKVTAQANLLACLTTVSSFGVLAFSSTHAVASFGMVVGVGVFMCCYLSPLSAIGVKK